MNNGNGISIQKSSGELEGFNESKLRSSLQRAGANDEIANNIIEAVFEILEEGLNSQKIYNKAFQMLKQHSRPTAARYKLKKAIFELGPSGYPFERFIAEVLSFQGFKTTVGVVVEGNCVAHEVDVIAEKDQERYLVECKFHTSPKNYCSVQVPLYIYARFEDINRKYLHDTSKNKKYNQGWIYTNTRFSPDALQYGKCVGLNLISWNYPEVGNLKERIELARLHPISCLTTLNRKEKQLLFKQSVVLCKQLLDDEQLLDFLVLNQKKKKGIMDEVKGLLSPLN